MEGLEIGGLYDMIREFEDWFGEFNLLEEPMMVGLKDWRT
jgi:hypothetical protein